MSTPVGDQIHLWPSRDEDGRWEVDATYQGRVVGIGIAWFREDAEADALAQAHRTLNPAPDVAA
ncbi:hypothetical protein CBQ26_00365 [Deinococcus indicus]|uniref:DUF2188 domain-containing protein n=1 Tax=Deinococcus indicus TaxID=223556 RepID=A0A246BTE4_9DEIO|nr:hypothetical protein [Deinococcus indicus]OWL98945.1 hypothetical protein CBQ26_00365 [Deinococcus indicus]